MRKYKNRSLTFTLILKPYFLHAVYLCVLIETLDLFYFTIIFGRKAGCVNMFATVCLDVCAGAHRPLCACASVYRASCWLKRLFLHSVFTLLTCTLAASGTTP